MVLPIRNFQFFQKRNLHIQVTHLAGFPSQLRKSVEQLPLVSVLRRQLVNQHFYPPAVGPKPVYVLRLLVLGYAADLPVHSIKNQPDLLVNSVSGSRSLRISGSHSEWRQQLSDVQRSFSSHGDCNTPLTIHRETL